MKIAIISDIHGNMDALEQVFADMQNDKIDQVICLGDNIGYGPEPERVIEFVQKQDVPCVQGNHELAIREPSYLNWFNAAARQSLKITATLLSDQSIDFIAELKPHLTIHGCRFVHGFPPDSPLIYLFQVSEGKAKTAMKALDERLCFIGHIHTLDFICYEKPNLEYGHLNEGVNYLEAGKRYIISVGSVGQPRDGNNKSKYVIWDISADTVEARFVKYDIAAVVKKIQAAGLPNEHAERLWCNPILT